MPFPKAASGIAAAIKATANAHAIIFIVPAKDANYFCAGQRPNPWMQPVSRTLDLSTTLLRLALPALAYLNVAAGALESLVVNYMPFSIIIIAHAALVIIILAIVVPQRVRMERRARALLAQYPNSERTTLHLKFRSALWSEKKKDVDAMISEMNAKGWTFLKASETNPLRTGLSWAGGLMMHFIRVR